MGGIGDADHHVPPPAGLAFEFGDVEGALSCRGGGHCAWFEVGDAVGDSVDGGLESVIRCSPG